MEPTVKMGHASAAIERRAYAEQIAAGEEPHAVTPRGQMNGAIHEARGLGVYIERGREWLHEMGDRLRERAELADQGMASFVQGAARTMRARSQTSTGDGFEAVTVLAPTPRSEQPPGIEKDRTAKAASDRPRHQERERKPRHPGT